MAITTPLMDEILQHFARVFPMPGRIDGREDYLALVKIWADQLEPYNDEQVKEACRRVMAKLKRFPYPSDVRDELVPASIPSTTVASLSIDVDTSSLDAAIVKVEYLKTKLSGALEAWQRAIAADFLDTSRFDDRRKIVDALCVVAKSGGNPELLADSARGLSAVVGAISITPSLQSSASHTAP